MKPRLWLIVSEGAWYPVEDDPPKGTYGIDWCVMRAESGPDALEQAPGLVTGVLPKMGAHGGECLSEQEALEAFDLVNARAGR